MHVPPTLAYTALIFPFAIVWFAVFIQFKSTRREQLIMSLFFLPFGPMSEMLYFQDYWNPSSIYLLKIGSFRLLIEDLLFSFFAGGIGVILYQIVFKMKFIREKRTHDHSILLLFLTLLASIIITFGLFQAGVNSIYATSIGLILNSCILFLQRRDLIKGAVMTGFLFTLVLFICYSIMYYSISNIEELASEIWKLYRTEHGIRFINIPVTELVWAFCGGFFVYPIYPDLFNLREKVSK